MNDYPFKGRLETLMGEQNKSEFARMCGVSESSIRKYLSGTQPRMDALAQIAEATGASIEWLATGRGAPFPVDVSLEIARKLDMKEQYAQAVYFRICEKQKEHNVSFKPENVWFAVSMINKLMIEKYEGEDATEEQLEEVLSYYVDELVKKAGWASW